LTGFAWPARSPPPRLPCAPRPFLPYGAFWRGRPAGKRDCVLVCAVATITLWVTASTFGSKRSARLTRLEGGFYSPLAAQLLSHVTGPVMTPARGAGDIACHVLLPQHWRGWRHQLPPSFPRSPGIIPVALSAEFSDRRAAITHFSFLHNIACYLTQVIILATYSLSTIAWYYIL